MPMMPVAVWLKMVGKMQIFIKPGNSMLDESFFSIWVNVSSGWKYPFTRKPIWMQNAVKQIKWMRTHCFCFDIWKKQCLHVFLAMFNRVLVKQAYCKIWNNGSYLITAYMVAARTAYSCKGLIVVAINKTQYEILILFYCVYNVHQHLLKKN